MGTNEQQLHTHGQPHKEHGLTLPIIGFILSIMLTLIALWAVMNRVMSAEGIIILILVLATIQIAIQLFMFMHVTESKGYPWHAWMLTFGFLLVAAIVAGSMWIMAFGAQAY